MRSSIPIHFGNQSEKSKFTHKPVSGFVLNENDMLNSLAQAAQVTPRQLEHKPEPQQMSSLNQGKGVSTLVMAATLMAGLFIGLLSTKRKVIQYNK